MTIKLLALAVLAASTACSAFAADMPFGEAAPQAGNAGIGVYDWSGFYLGGQGGYSWTKGVLSGSDQDFNKGFAGAHAGYNFQSGSIVYGIENDFNYNFDQKGTQTLEWDASGRARVGYAMDRTLIYGTAGIAAAGGKVERPTAGKKDDILIGWTAGAGVEHAVTDNILIRGEYRYTDFGDKDFGGSLGKFGATQNKVIVGVGYRF